MFIAVSLGVALFLIPYPLGILLCDPVSWNKNVVAMKWIDIFKHAWNKVSRRSQDILDCFLW